MRAGSLVRPPGSPVILALDTADLDQALAWARVAGEAVGMVKVGLELFSAVGPEAVRVLRASGWPVMLDLKLHDIPATVGRAAAALAPLEPALLTVHAAGGPAMLRAAVEAAGPSVRVAAITVLTSLGPDELGVLGWNDPVPAAVRLGRLAVAAGCRGLVCAPGEASALRAAVGNRALLVCPGVRPAGASGDDQARTCTPAEAVRGGADLLVVGRPVTRSADPAAAARAVRDQAMGLAARCGGPP